MGRSAVSTAPASGGVAGKRIGDILLAHGFVTEEELAAASAEQEQTKQPLGQILVQHGAITRLELASALAEQWSDPSASISLITRSTAPKSVAVAAQHNDDDQYAARLQNAVADLARRVQANEPLEGINDRVTELGQRTEATLARTQRLEATVATLVESLEGVTGGVEEAFTAIQQGMAELASDLTRIDAAVAELAQRPAAPESNPHLEETLNELRAAVAVLDGHPAAIEQVSGRIDELAGRLETLVDASALDDLRGALAAIEGRPSHDSALDSRLDQLEGLATGKADQTEVDASFVMLAELTETTTALQARPAGDPELDERLARIETGLVEVQEQSAAAVSPESLSEHVAAMTARQDELGSAIAAFGERIEQVATQPAGDPELLDRLIRLEERLDADRSSLAEQIRDEILGRVGEILDERLGQVWHDLGDMRGQLGELANRTHDEAASPDALRELDARVGALMETIADVAARPTGDDGLGERLEAMEQSRATDADMIEVLLMALDRIREDLKNAEAASSAPSKPDPEVVGRLVALEELAPRLDELAPRLDELAPRLDQLSAEIDERLAALVRPVSADDSEVIQHLERVRLSIERFGLHLGEHDRALADLTAPRGVEERLDELAAQVEELAASGPRGDAPPSSAGLPSGDLGALMRRVEEAETASQADRERLMSRLEKMGSSIDWRLQRLETGEPE